jgi:PAS domain S-box-containing protein
MAAGANGQVAGGLADPAVGPDRPPPTPPEWSSDREPIEFAFDADVLTDAHGIVLDANTPAAQLFQCRREFMLGKPIGLFVDQSDRAIFYDHLSRLPGVGNSDTLKLRVGRRGPDVRDVIAVTTAVGDGENGRTVAYRWLLRDVTGVERTERELRRERELLDGLVDAADAIILLVDSRGQIIRSNGYLHDVSGCAAHELHGEDWASTLLTPEDRPAGRRVLTQALTHGSGRSGPLAFRVRAGALRSVIWSARGLASGGESVVALIGHDVTELQEAQIHAVQVERLAAIGQMAAGLAHESRNALQRSQACLSLLGLRLADRPDVTDLLERAQRAQDDLHRLYEGMLNYAAPVRVDVRPCDLATVWREAWADLAGIAGWGDAELLEAGDGVNTRALADAFHMRRVFRNLFENARTAATGPLRVTITRAPTTLGQRPALQVSVRDNGPGFLPATRGRLFQAFFTTKMRGTGLGLALCKRVIDEHGGLIEAGPGGPGAEVIIILPRSTS